MAPITVTGYDAASRVTTIATTETAVHYGYNDANRVIWEDQILAGYPTRHIEEAPDADGNPAQLSVKTNTVSDFLVYYDFTQRNQLAHITQTDNSALFTYEYDSAGNMTRRRGDILGDSINVPSASYDPLNRPTYWENTRGGNAWFSRPHYQYDNVGREVAVWRDEDGNKGERYWFNTSNHLTRAAYKADSVWTANPANVGTDQLYAYSAGMLNRASVSENGVVTNYAPPTGLNQYTSVGATSVQYDGNFNLSVFGTATATYNAKSQLTAVNNGNTAQFVYDGLGRCVKRTVNGVSTLFAYDGWKPVVEYDGAGNRQAQNIYGPGPDEILLRGSGYGWFFYHADKQGNVTALVDLNGNVVEKYTYDAFGKPTILSANNSQLSTSAVGNRFMYTGREWIAELNLYDYRNRFYFPLIGRFLQTDPLGLQTEGEKLSEGQKALFFSGGSAPEAFGSSEMNLFRYCGDDPLDLSDPMGLEVRGLDIIDSPSAKVPFVTIPGADKYGGIEWALRPNIVTQPVTGGYRASVHGLDVVAKRAQIATRVKVKGERVARYRSDTQIGATVEHEKDLHGEIAITFDRNNQNREFKKVYGNENEARSKAFDQMYKDFDKAQSHDNPAYKDRFREVMKRESFR